MRDFPDQRSLKFWTYSVRESCPVKYKIRNVLAVRIALWFLFAPWRNCSSLWKIFTINFSPRVHRLIGAHASLDQNEKMNPTPTSGKREIWGAPSRPRRRHRSYQDIASSRVKRLLLCFVLMELVVVHSRDVRSLHSFTVDSNRLLLNWYYCSFVSTFNDRPGSREFYHETSRPRLAIASAPTARLANATQKFSDGDAAQREGD